jgi:hypothetical protein
MGVPILIFLVAFAIGSVAPARWLPDLAPGSVGGLALMVVCGLLGIALALIAVHAYELIRQLDQAGPLGLSAQKPDTTANAILTTLRDVGPILGLAAAAYLLAPAPDEDQPSQRNSSPPGPS